MNKEQPLAARLRPRTLDEFVGQEHILAPGRLLRRAIYADQLSSLIFYGPPGTGKTTLASVIANTTQSDFETLNAVLSGVSDIRQVTEAAKKRCAEYQQRTILFVDEVHRWNKAQQDALLPWVENGTVILIGATTENPYFTVNRPLVSRSRVFQLKPLEDKHLYQVVQQALGDRERGYGNLNVQINQDALDHIIDVANGDARAMLNALELAVETTEAFEDGTILIDMSVAEDSIQKRAVLYDKEGDYHFDTISAFIKSLRGSDPDAALYWMAKMIYAGEDPRFLFRRMLIFAGEDVGLAAPEAVGIINSAAEAFDRVGMPEGQYHLGSAALYLATVPKSNSVMAFFDALSAVEKEQEQEVPNHLKDPNRDQDELGHGRGYVYPHAYREHWVAQQYMPQGMQGRVFYEPGENGYEKEIAQEVRRKREAQLAATLEQAGVGTNEENLTFSPSDKQFDAWLNRTAGENSLHLEEMRDVIFSRADCKRHHVLLVLNADNGLLLWEALRQVPEGGVYAIVSNKQAADTIDYQLKDCPDLLKPHILVHNTSDLKSLKDSEEFSGVKFDRIVGRNCLPGCEPEKTKHFFGQTAELLNEEGKVVLVQPLPKYGQRLYDLLDPERLKDEVQDKLKKAEEDIYCNSSDESMTADESSLQAKASVAFHDADCETEVMCRDLKLHISEVILDRWFSCGENTEKWCYSDYLRQNLTEEELEEVEKVFRQTLKNRLVNWQMVNCIITIRRKSC